MSCKDCVYTLVGLNIPRLNIMFCGNKMKEKDPSYVVVDSE